MIEKYSAPWLEGYVEELARLGCDEQTAKALVKAAAESDLMSNPYYQEAYAAEMDRLVKSAAPLPPSGTIAGALVDALMGSGGKLLKNPAFLIPGMVAGGLGAKYGYENLIEPYWGRGTFENDLNQMAKAWQKGLISDTTYMAAQNRIARQRAKSLAEASGYRDYGYPSWIY